MMTTMTTMTTTMTTMTTMAADRGCPAFADRGGQFAEHSLDLLLLLGDRIDLQLLRRPQLTDGPREVERAGAFVDTEL